MFGFLGSLAGGLTSMFGSMFGANQQARAAQQANAYNQYYNANKISMTVQDAKRAGIHPLAALGSPAAGQFAAPVVSNAGDTIAEGARSAGKHVSDALSSLDTENKNLQNQYLRAQIAKTAAETMLTDTQSRTQAAKLLSATQGGGAKQLSVIGGKVIQHSPTFSDAQDLENRYGEMSDVAGPWIADADLRKTTGKGLLETGWNIANKNSGTGAMVADMIQREAAALVEKWLARGPYRQRRHPSARRQ